jgi:hypothetical protein
LMMMMAIATIDRRLSYLEVLCTSVGFDLVAENIMQRTVVSVPLGRLFTTNCAKSTKKVSLLLGLPSYQLVRAEPIYRSPKIPIGKCCSLSRCKRSALASKLCLGDVRGKAGCWVIVKVIVLES